MKDSLGFSCVVGIYMSPNFVKFIPHLCRIIKGNKGVYFETSEGGGGGGGVIRNRMLNCGGGGGGGGNLRL